MKQISRKLSPGPAAAAVATVGFILFSNGLEFPSGKTAALRGRQPVKSEAVAQGASVCPDAKEARGPSPKNSSAYDNYMDFAGRKSNGPADSGSFARSDTLAETITGQTNAQTAQGKGDFASCYKLGVEKMDAGDWKGAIAQFSKAIKLDRKSAEAYRGRGHAKEMKKDHAGALKDLDIAIGLAPGDASSYKYRGYARVSLHMGRKAIADFDVAISLNPGDAESYNGRGCAKLDMGKINRSALKDFDMAITLDPKMWEAYYNRAIVKSEMDDIKGAIGDLDIIIANSPKDADAYYARAEARSLLGDEAGAKEDNCKARLLEKESKKKR
ncbi:TPR repeat protein [uncultured archaeon]|nr:TPR repeat protein [uncultured archaeon]